MSDKLKIYEQAARLDDLRLNDSDIDQFFESPVWLALRQVVARSLKRQYDVLKSPELPERMLRFAQGCISGMEWMMDSRARFEQGLKSQPEQGDQADARPSPEDPLRELLDH